MKREIETNELNDKVYEGHERRNRDCEMHEGTREKKKGKVNRERREEYKKEGNEREKARGKREKDGERESGGEINTAIKERKCKKYMLDRKRLSS